MTYWGEGSIMLVKTEDEEVWSGGLALVKVRSDEVG